eukprot:6172066-Pleurochrysis_carterae.AAC.2
MAQRSVAQRPTRQRATMRAAAPRACRIQACPPRRRSLLTSSLDSTLYIKYPTNTSQYNGSNAINAPTRTGGAAAQRSSVAQPRRGARQRGGDASVIVRPRGRACSAESAPEVCGDENQPRGTSARTQLCVQCTPDVRP